MEVAAPLSDRSRRRLLTHCGVTTGVFASANILPALALPSIARQFELTDAKSGLIFGVGAIVNFAALPIFGILSEKIGKRGLLAVGMALLAIALGIFRGAPSFGYLLVAAAVLGVASAIVEAMISPLVADISPERTAPVMNVVHACYQVGMVITAIAAGVYLARLGTWNAIFIPTIGLSAVLAIIFAASRFPAPVVHEAPHGVLQLFKQAPFWLFAIGIAGAGGVEAGIVNWVSSFLQRKFEAGSTHGVIAEWLHLADPAPLLGAIGVVLFASPMILGRWFYGSIGERFGLIPTLIGSCAIASIALIGLGFSDGVAASIIWLSIVGLAISGMWPTILTSAGARIRTNPPTLFAPCFRWPDCSASEVAVGALDALRIRMGCSMA